MIVSHEKQVAAANVFWIHASMHKIAICRMLELAPFETLVVNTTLSLKEMLNKMRWAAKGAKFRDGKEFHVVITDEHITAWRYV
jgi:hypothetical protein